MKTLASLLAAVALLLVPQAAHAVDPSGPVVLEFSNGNCTDPTEEDADIKTALEEVAASVTLFDGGDGTGAAWSAALDGIDVLVFPEGCNFGTAAIDSSAAAVIKTWVESGHIVVGTGSYDHGAFVSYMSGLDFTSEFNNNASTPGTWTLQTDNPDLPATVPYADATNGLMNYSQWAAEKRAFVTPVYYDEVNDNLAVAYFTFGEGYYIYNAYDWYPNPDDVTSGARATWNETLQFAATGAISPNPRAVPEVVEEEPALAETGAGDIAGPLGMVALLTALGVAVAMIRRKAVV